MEYFYCIIYLVLPLFQFVNVRSPGLLYNPDPFGRILKSRALKERVVELYGISITRYLDKEYLCDLQISSEILVDERDRNLEYAFSCWNPTYIMKLYN